MLYASLTIFTNIFNSIKLKLNRFSLSLINKNTMNKTTLLFSLILSTIKCVVGQCVSFDLGTPSASTITLVYIDRTYQCYNEIGNPDFGELQFGNWSIIHGIALTKYANEFIYKDNKKRI